VDVDVSEHILTVHLADGRSIAVPVVWYPRLAEGTSKERAHWELVGGGRGIHWPDLDEDIRVEALLAGQRSKEGPASLKKWRSRRRRNA
jgi:hypothetical protein